jgi:hypothetical protein
MNRKRSEMLTYDQQRLAREYSKCLPGNHIEKRFDASAPTLRKHKYTGPVAPLNETWISSLSLDCAGFHVSSKYPVVQWERDGVKVNLGWDYLPTIIVIGDTEHDLEFAVYTIGHLEEEIKRLQQP